MVSNNFDKDKVNVFVSYSHQDSLIPQLFNDFEKKDPSINFWLDTELGSGENWNETIRKNVENCDFFIIFISPSILLSEYVFREELEIIFKRSKKQKKDNQTLIFPYILNYNCGVNSTSTISSKIKFLLKNINKPKKTEEEKTEEEKIEEKNLKTYKRNLEELSFFLAEKQVKKFTIENYIPFPNRKKDFNNIYNKILNNINISLTKNYKTLKQGLEIEKYLKFDEYYASKILDIIKDCNGGTYFNTQIELTKWFNPALQLNLSLQKEIEEIIDYKSIIKRINKETKDRLLKDELSESPLVTKTRISRILILPFSQQEIKNWKNSKNLKESTRYHNLIALNNIHKMMGSPMAILGYDQLFDILYKTESILDKNGEDSGHKDYKEPYLTDKELFLLGIGFTNKYDTNYDGSLISKDEKYHIKDIDNQREKLKILIQKQVVEDNSIKPSIDFACFSNIKDKEFDDKFYISGDLENALNIINEKKPNTVIFKAGIDNGTKYDERKLVFFDFKNVQDYEDDKANGKEGFDKKENKLGNIYFDLIINEYNSNNYFKASQKFAFLIDYCVFEKKKVRNVDDFEELNSNKLIYNLNKKGGAYEYKEVKNEYNIKKIFNL